MFAPDDRRVDGLSIGLKRLDVARTKGELVSAFDEIQRWLSEHCASVEKGGAFSVSAAS
jgi:hypothetical protein